MNIRFYLEDTFLLGLESSDFLLKDVYDIKFGLSDYDQIWLYYMEGDERKNVKLLHKGALELMVPNQTLSSFAEADKIVLESKREILVFEKGKPREYRRKNLLYNFSLIVRGI